LKQVVDMNQNRVFRSTGDEFRNRTHQRLFVEALFLGVAIFLSVTNWLEQVPRWIALTIAAVIAAILVFDLVYYRRGKVIAESFSIELLPDALAFSHERNRGTVPYKDIKISGVKKRDGKVIEITLLTAFRQSIKLRDLDGMQELHDSLVGHLGH
jgi:hypothetical protein